MAEIFYPRLSVSYLLTLPSVDSYGDFNETVGDLLYDKITEIETEYQYEGYLHRWRDHGQETPVHVFRGYCDIGNYYQIQVPDHLHGAVLFGNGHHRLAMAVLTGVDSLMFTDEVCDSYTNEDG